MKLLKLVWTIVPFTVAGCARNSDHGADRCGM
jgi:hypothetical protein